MPELKNLTDPETSALMQDIASGVEYTLKEFHKIEGNPLFCVLVFNDPEIAQYVSSCSREDMILALRETANILEQGEDISNE